MTAKGRAQKLFSANQAYAPSWSYPGPFEEDDMRKLIMSALLAAVAAGPALAQDYGDRREWNESRREWRDDRRDFQNDRREWRDARRDGVVTPGERREWREDRREFQRDKREFYGARREWRDDRRDWRYERNYRDPRWAGSNWNGRSYYHPRGVYYRPYEVGYSLPRSYWGRSYWIDRHWDYRLSRPYAGARWVRVGPDAVLVRVNNGRVLDVRRDIFW